MKKINFILIFIISLGLIGTGAALKISPEPIYPIGIYTSTIATSLNDGIPSPGISSVVTIRSNGIISFQKYNYIANVQIKINGNNISFPTRDVSNNILTWRNGNYYVNFTFMNSYLKENIWIRRNTDLDLSRISWVITNSSNLQYIVDNGNVIFSDVITGEKEFYFPAPFVIDSRTITNISPNQPSPNKFYGNWILNNNILTQTINLNGAIFPITFDPTINIYPSSISCSAHDAGNCPALNDNATDNYWINSLEFSTLPATATYTFSTGYNVVNYSATTFYSATSYRPLSLYFYGSNDNINFDLLDSWYNIMVPNANQTISRDFVNPNTYQYYKFNIPNNTPGSATFTIIEEFQLRKSGITPAPLIANFTANRTSGDMGQEPQAVQFNDTSTTGSGTINAWGWNYTPASTGNRIFLSSNQNPQYLFSVGNYSITLNVSSSAPETNYTYFKFWVNVSSIPGNVTCNTNNLQCPACIKTTCKQTNNSNNNLIICFALLGIVLMIVLIIRRKK